MPTDNSVFRIAPANDMSLPIAVENLGSEAFKVEVNLAPGTQPICVKSTPEAPLVVDASVTLPSEPLQFTLESDVCIKNAVGAGPLAVDANLILPSEPIEVNATLVIPPAAPPISVDGEIKFCWNENCDVAVPVFGRMEICNGCDDAPLKIEIAQTSASDPLCVEIGNKNAQPLCVQSVSSTAPLTRPKTNYSCQYALANYQEADSFFLPNYIGGYYPLACAPPNQAVRVKQINYRLYSKAEPEGTTEFASESFIFLESDGESAPFFTAGSICDLTSGGAVSQTPIPAAPPGTTCGVTNPPPPDTAATYIYTLDMPEQFGAPLTLAANDTAVLFYEQVNPVDSTFYGQPDNDLQIFDVQTRGCCEPISSCTPVGPAEPVSVYVTDASSNTFLAEDSSVGERIEFCIVDCFGAPVTTGGPYTVTFEYGSDLDSGATTVEKEAMVTAPGSNKYRAEFPDLPAGTFEAKFTVKNSEQIDLFATKTVYTFVTTA